MLGEDGWRRLAPLPPKLVGMCISVLAPKEPGGGEWVTLRQQSQETDMGL